MPAVIHAFHRKTETKCPICGENMHMVHFHNKTRSFMCLKCHFGFNYKD